MAYKTVVETFDDLDGQTIEAGGEAIEFSANGEAYSISLQDENSAEFRSALIGHIRRIGGHKRWATELDGVLVVRLEVHKRGYRLRRRSGLSRTVFKNYSAAHSD